MNWRVTLGMVVVFLALAEFVYFTELQRQAQAQAARKPKGPQILNLNPAEINRFEVTHEGKTVLVVKDEGGTWQLKAPEEMEADQTRMQEMAERIGNLAAERLVVEKADDLAPFGLDKPQVEATIGTAPGPSILLLVGKENLERTAYYLKRADADPIYLVTSFTAGRLKGLVNEPPKPWRTPTPVPQATPEGLPVPKG